MREKEREREREREKEKDPLTTSFILHATLAEATDLSSSVTARRWQVLT